MAKFKGVPRLSEILTERKMTQAKLSDLSGVPQAAISRFDKTSQGSYDNLISIAKALDIPIEELFKMSERKE